MPDVVSGWLKWECMRADVPLVSPIQADVVFLVFAGALDWLSECTRQLRKEGIEPIAKKRHGKPYVITGGPVDAIPFTALTVADALTIGEAYTFVRELLEIIRNGKDVEIVKSWTVSNNHAIERSQIEIIEKDAERPWLLKQPAPVLAIPDDYIDWEMPPIRSDDKVVRLIAEKGCHCKCTFCATTYRQKHQQNENSDKIIETLALLKKRGERVQLVSNDPMGLKYFRNIGTKLDSQSFTIMEISDDENRKAIIHSGIGIARFGVEGISERVRRAFAKPIDNKHLLEILAELHNNKINTHMFFIVGSPGENESDWLAFRDFYWDLARTIKTGICRIKFTTFVNTPPAPLARFIPGLQYQAEMNALRAWIGNNAASRHLLYVRGRGGDTHLKNVAEQTGISYALASQLCTSEITDLAPSLDDAFRLPWEVVKWPIDTETRWNIGTIYSRRMEL